MFNLIKKDFMTLSNSDLGSLLLMPIILIVVLGSALNGLIGEDATIETFNVGIVTEQNFDENLNQFENELSNQGLPPQASEPMLATARETDPEAILLDTINSEEFSEIITVKEYTSTDEANTDLENENIEGIITIPENFSYQSWDNLFLDGDQPAELDLVTRTEDSFYGSILESILTTFVEKYNLEMSITQATDGQAKASTTSSVNEGRTYLTVEEPVNAFQYYTLAMGVMFALFTAPSLASNAFREKEQHVFGRIMLSGTKPLSYLTSKLISGTLITFVQLAILFVSTTLIFGTFSSFGIDVWLNMFYITSLYSLLVGSVTAFLTSMALSADNITTVNFFSSFIAIFSFLGGSFVPVETFSETLKDIGNWTPNGASLTSYLQAIQGFEFAEYWPLMLRVVGMTLVLIVVAYVVFPKRRLD